MLKGAVTVRFCGHLAIRSQADLLPATLCKEVI